MSRRDRKGIACGRGAPRPRFRFWAPVAASAVLLAAFGFSPSQAAAASSTVQEADTSDLAERYAALCRAYDDARADFDEELRRRQASAAGRGKRARSAEAPHAPEIELFPAFAALAEEGSLSAGVWVLQHYSHGPARRVNTKRRADVLASQRAKLRTYLQVLAGGPTERQLYDVSLALKEDCFDAAELPGQAHRERPDRLGHADAFPLLGLVRTLAKTDEMRATTLWICADAIYDDAASAENNLRAARWYREAAERYPNTPAGARAAGSLFAAERLQVGMVAPELAGVDFDGRSLRLSATRGKVCVVEFWGFW